MSAIHHRRVRGAAATLLVLFLCGMSAVAGVSPALAARGHVFGGAFGAKGSGEGQFETPAGIAVDEETGDVYVVDKGSNRVEYFSASGAYQGEFNGSGLNVLVEGIPAPMGRFSRPDWVTVDNDPESPSFGDVYVADEGHAVIDKFTSTGHYVGQLTETTHGATFGRLVGIQVDKNGVLWVAQSSEEVDAFSNAVSNEFLSGRFAYVRIPSRIRFRG